MPEQRFESYNASQLSVGTLQFLAAYGENGAVERTEDIDPAAPGGMRANRTWTAAQEARFA